MYPEVLKFWTEERFELLIILSKIVPKCLGTEKALQDKIDTILASVYKSGQKLYLINFMGFRFFLLLKSYLPALC